MDINPTNINVEVWNLRGLNCPARRSVARTAISEAGASVVCVSESKLQLVTPYIVVESFGPGFDGFAYLPSVGSAGGVIIAWKSQVVSVLAQRIDRFSVSVLLSQEGGQPWWLTTVYGPTVDDMRALFLDEFRMLRGSLAGPWAVAGDFNMILDMRDKNNANINRRRMAMFRRFVNDLELRDANLLGRRYTWSNGRDPPTLERLDRWFSSLDWDALHPTASLSALSSSLSDHAPLLMSTAASGGSLSRAFGSSSMGSRRPSPRLGERQLRCTLIRCAGLISSSGGWLGTCSGGVPGGWAIFGTKSSSRMRLFASLIVPRTIVP
jgi:hypothetical protein